MGLAVAAVVLGLASLALIAWDQIFNDGALLKRFVGMVVRLWLDSGDSGLGCRSSDASYCTEAWQKAIGIFEEHFAAPIITAWETVRDFFGESCRGLLHRDHTQCV